MHIDPEFDIIVVYLIFNDKSTFKSQCLSVAFGKR
nr:MAG TPA: hypothetical protein [Caudoviricetes sp.]